MTRSRGPVRSGRSRWVAGLLPAVLMALASCGQSSLPPTSSPTPMPSLSPQPSLVPAADLKPMIHGLVDRFGPPPATFAGTVTNFVVDADWSELQPAQNGPLAPDNVIDQAIAAAQSLDQQNTSSGSGQGTVEVKIRLMAGVDAPAWAQQLGGGPVTLVNPQGGSRGTVGRFWTSAFGQAYDELWSKLAAAYDNVPQINEITVARCMTFTDEPFLRDVSDPANVQALLAAGFSLSADEQCEQQEIQVGTDWRHTRIGVAFNPYQAIQSDGSAPTDEAYSASMMRYCRTELGAQCVLENNSIRTPPLSGAYTEMYATMEELGPPITFQTATEDKIGSLQTTLEWAAAIGADAVELPSQYTQQTPASLQPAAAQLQENPVVPLASTTAQPTPSAGASESESPTSASALPTVTIGGWTGEEPATIYFSTDGSDVVTGLTWASWNRTEAVGFGSRSEVSCTPSCAGGTATSYTVTITMSAPQNGEYTTVVEQTADGMGTTQTFDAPNLGEGACTDSSQSSCIVSS